MSHQSWKNNLGRFVKLSFLFTFAVLFYSLVMKRAIFTIYQGRDIQRTFELLSGHWIWYGPDLSGGGHTPGPFFYYLLSIPLGLFGTWQSVLWLNILLAAASVTILWSFLKTQYDSLTAIIFYFLYLSSSIFQICILQFWNPSFLPFFQALLICLFINHKTLSLKSMAMGGLLIGLTAQIHYQQTLFLIGILIALGFDQSTTKKQRLTSMSVVTLFALLPCLPYFIIENAKNGTDHSFASGFKSLTLTFVNLGDLSQLKPGFLKFFNRELVNEPGFIILVFLWMVWLFVKQAPGKRLSFDSPFLVATLVFSFFFVLPNVYQPSYLRYGMPFFLCFYLLSAQLLSVLCKTYPKASLVGVVLFAIAVLSPFWIGGHNSNLTVPTLISVPILALISFFLFEKKTGIYATICLVTLFYLMQSFYLKDRPRELPNRQFFVETLLHETGWTWEYLRERAFIVGKLPEEDISTFYKQAYRDAESEIEVKDFDGVLVNYEWEQRKQSFFGNGGESKINWASLGGYLPYEILSMALNGSLRCEVLYRRGFHEFCFYKFTRPTHKFTFNNQGYPYQYNQPLLDIVNEVPESKGGRRLEDGTWLFFWNNCKNREPACTVYFFVKKLKDGLAKVTVKGDPLSVPQAIANPAWALSLENLALEVVCDGHRSSHKVATLIGYANHGRGYKRPTFLGPFRNHVEMTCSNPSELALVSTRAVSEFKTVTPPHGKLSIVWRNSHKSRYGH